MVPARQTQRVIYSLKTSFQYGHKYHVVHSYKSGLVSEISAVQSFRVISSEFQIHTRGLSSSEIKQVSLSRRDQLQAEMCPYCSLGTNILADIRLRNHLSLLLQFAKQGFSNYWGGISSKKFQNSFQMADLLSRSSKWQVI